MLFIKMMTIKNEKVQLPKKIKQNKTKQKSFNVESV